MFTTDHLPTFGNIQPRPVAAVMQPAVAEGMPPNYVPPRMMPEERRGYPRREIRTDIYVTLGGRELCLEGHDVSAGGICCGSVPNWASCGDPILVRLPGSVRQILGRVAWVRRRSDYDQDQMVGIRFSIPQCGMHVLD